MSPPDDYFDSKGKDRDRDRVPQLEFLNNVALQMAILSSKFTGWQDSVLAQFQHTEEEIKEAKEEAKERILLIERKHDRLEAKFVARANSDDIEKQQLREQIVTWRGQLEVVKWLIGSGFALFVALFGYLLTQIHK